MSDDLAAKVRRVILHAWREQDPGVVIRTRERADGLLDLTVVTRLFEGMEAFEREPLLWSALRDLTRYDAIHLTYSLLLTPSESVQFESLREESL